MAMGNSERIDKFLRGCMTPEEDDAFMNDFNSDKVLREETQITALMIQELQERQTKEDSDIIEEVLATKKKAKTIRLVKWIGSIAAMFILLFGANQWYTSYKTDKVFDTYYTPYDASLASKGGDDETIKQELAELYNKVGTEKNVTSVISRLQTIYDGIQSVSDDYADYTYYENDIAWYLALAYIKDHNLEKAQKLLKPFADNGDEEAITLLKAIEAL